MSNPKKVRFEVVLVHLEERGWVLLKIYRRFLRVFARGSNEPPIIIRVDDNGNVDGDQFEAIKPYA